MWTQMVLLMPVLLPTLVVKTTNCVNNSDVFFLGGHVEADIYTQKPSTTVTVIPSSTPPVPTTQQPTSPSGSTTVATTVHTQFEDETEAVIFIPNHPPAKTDESHKKKKTMSIKDLLEKNQGLEDDDEQYRIETESPGEIVFITEKNGYSREEKQERKRQREKGKKQEEPAPVPLDCDHLDCNNTIKSVCGARSLDRDWRYRLFLNYCYFKKVNCNFRYESSRYIEVPLEKCHNIGAHLEEKPFSFKPRYHDIGRDLIKTGARRSFSSRRSMAMNMDGQFCSHPCPVSCPDDYEPECAVSATGQRKVFMNHCKLDDNSCLFGVVWHKRPLSECVGGKKADMRQNRFFIGWMQRVGILDNKGRLVLE